MVTLYFSSPSCLAHDPNPEHPECPERLVAIEEILHKHPLLPVQFRKALPAKEEDLLLAHSAEHIKHVFENIPSGRALYFLDADTVVCSGSKEAALHAVGAVLGGVDAVLNGNGLNAFCAVRPPGHHAHREHAAGFCLFNNIAIGALAAIERYGLQRIAILDFDVHHGDGTQDIVRNNPDIFFASTYQYPLYASDGTTKSETGIRNNVLNIPFPPEAGSRTIIDTWTSVILPKVKNFQPEMLFVSAGFDGHRDDPLSQWRFTENDYAELMQAIVDLADECCQGKLVAVLEGGYNLKALSQSVLACLKVMEK